MRSSWIDTSHSHAYSRTPILNVHAHTNSLKWYNLFSETSDAVKTVFAFDEIRIIYDLFFNFMLDLSLSFCSIFSLFSVDSFKSIAVFSWLWLWVEQSTIPQLFGKYSFVGVWPSSSIWTGLGWEPGQFQNLPECPAVANIMFTVSAERIQPWGEP